MKIRGQFIYPPAERIMRMSELCPETGCWLWNGTTRGGYGRLCVGRRAGRRHTVSAHRYSYEIFVGPIPDGMEICHRCDVRRCVNPAHLFAGTRQDNIDDRERKGRNCVQFGVDNGAAKLSVAEVQEMRALNQSGLGCRKIAAMFGVNKKTAMHAIRGRAWKCVPMLPAPPVPDTPNKKSK